MLKTLDSYIDERQIQFIHFLKMDVEGHELEVLKGAKRAIGKKQIGIIQFEFGKANISSRVFMKDFFDLLDTNYTIHKILRDGISDKLSYSEKLEVFMTTNYLAVPKEKIQLS